MEVDSNAMDVDTGARTTDPFSVFSRNGGVVAERYIWSQTPEEVTVRIFVPPEVSARDVKLVVTEDKLSLRLNSGRVILEGDWDFRIEPEEDDDWEVTNIDNRRAVRVTVRKKIPMAHQMRIWWSRVLKGEPAIDVKQIEGRLNKDPNAFGKAWAEAHAMFKEKAKSREKIVIDT